MTNFLSRGSTNGSSPSNFNNLSNKYKNYNIGEFTNRTEETINEYFLLSPEDLKKRTEKNTAVEDMMQSSFIL